MVIEAQHYVSESPILTQLHWVDIVSFSKICTHFVLNPEIRGCCAEWDEVSSRRAIWRCQLDNLEGLRH